MQVKLESAFESGSSLAKSASTEGGPEKLTSTAVPAAFALLQNYPNPFSSGTRSRLAENPSTVIRFALPEAGEVTLGIYATTGQLVRQLASGTYAAGLHHVRWDGGDQSGHVVTAGMYFYRIIVHGANGEAVFAQTRRMAFVK